MVSCVPQVGETANTKWLGLTDGAGVASQSVNEDTSARLWDLNTRKSLNVFPSDSNYRMVPLGFSPEGAMLVATGIRGTVVSNLTTGLGHVLEGQPDDVFKFALSTDGKRFASSTVSGNVLIGNMTSGKILCQLPARHGQGAATLMFSHDDTRSLTGDQEDTIRLRNMQTRELLQTIQGRGIDALLNLGGTMTVFKPSLIQNDAALQQIVLWNVSANQRAHQWSGRDRSLAFSPDSHILA